jgi:hypothetical protein
VRSTAATTATMTTARFGDCDRNSDCHEGNHGDGYDPSER